LRQALPHLLQHASTPLQVHIYQEEITPGLIESGMPVPYIVVDRRPSRR